MNILVICPFFIQKVKAKFLEGIEFSFKRSKFNNMVFLVLTSMLNYFQKKTNPGVQVEMISISAINCMVQASREETTALV